jgi:hypothetical protein
MEEIPLPWEHTSGDFQVDETYVYLAMPGCPSLIRLHKQTLEQEVIYASVPQPSVTSLLVHEGQIYCGGDGAVFRVKDWKSDMEVFATSAYPTPGMAVYDGFLYGFASPRDITPAYFFRVPVGGAIGPPFEAERLSEGSGNPFVRTLLVDPRGALVYTPTSQWNYGSISAYVPALNEVKVMAYKVGTGGGIDSDGKHYYFTHTGKCCVNQELWDLCTRGVCCNRTCSAVVRMAIDAPFETFPPWE